MGSTSNRYNCCKNFEGEPAEMSLAIHLKGHDPSKGDEVNEEFTFEKAVELIHAIDKKALQKELFSKGVRLFDDKKIFTKDILLNSALKPSLYKLAEFKNNFFEAKKYFNEYFTISTLKQNKHIVRALGYLIDQDKESISFLYEFLDDTLENYIQKKSIDLRLKIQLIKNIAETMIYIHSKGILLLDLSPRDIMFDNKWRLRFTTFGNCVNFDKSLSFLNNKANYTTILNVAPELLLQGDVYWHCDIWSLGVLITQLFTGITSYLFEEKKEKETADEFRESTIENFKKRVVPTIIDKIEDVFVKAIVVGMLRYNPEERPNIFKFADTFNNYLKKFGFENDLIMYDKNQKESFLNIFPEFG